MFYDKKMVPYVLAIFFIVFDRLFKLLAVKGFLDEFPAENLFRLNFSANYNIAFSLPLSGTFLEILIGLICLGLILLLLFFLKKGRLELVYPVFLLILGASSNFYDRLQFGYVIDYLDLSYFTVFNLADMMIIAGVMLFFYKYLTNR